MRYLCSQSQTTKLTVKNKKATVQYPFILAVLLQQITTTKQHIKKTQTLCNNFFKHAN